MSKFQELFAAREACANAAEWLWCRGYMPAVELRGNAASYICAVATEELVIFNKGRAKIADAARWLAMYRWTPLQYDDVPRVLRDLKPAGICPWFAECLRNYDRTRQAVADNALAHWSRFDKACRNWLEKAEPADIRDTPVPSFSFADGGPFEVQFVPAFIGIGLRGREYVFPTADGYRGPFPTMPERATPANKTTVINIWVKRGDRLDSACADAARWLWATGYVTNSTWLRAEDQETIIKMSRDIIRKLDENRLPSADKARTLAIDYGLGVNSIVYASQQGDI